MAEHDDLLSPTLSRKDDLVGFRRPWNPWHLVLATFFGGPVGGGWLLSRNFTRLGERAKEPWCMIAFVVLAVLVSYGSVHWLGAGVIEGEREREAGREARMIVRGVSTLAAVIVAGMQARRFRLFTMSGGETGKLLATAIGAILLGALVHFGIVFVVVMLAVS